MRSTAIKRKAPEPPDEIERLEHEREVLNAEQARLRKIEDAAGEADRRVAEIDVALVALGGAERVAVEAWAAGGAIGDPPEPDVAGRRQLEAERALGVADRSAATVRHEAVGRRQAEIAADIANVSLEIRRIKIGRAMEKIRGLAAEVDTLAVELRDKWQDVIAAGKALSEAAASGSSADARAHSLLIGALQALDAIPPPDLSWQIGEINALVPPWRAAFA